MVVVGYKVQKLSASKAALWVRFTSPSEYVGKTIQMYPKSLEPKKGPACGADFSLLRAISASHSQATILRDLGINSSSSTALTSTMIRHFSSMQKPQDSMTAVFDDHYISVYMNTELQLDFPVLPPQQSIFDNLDNFQDRQEKMNKAIDADIEQLQKRAAQLACTLPPTTDVPFRLSCKTLQSVVLAPVLPPPTALPSDDDNGPLPESGPHDYSRSTPDPKHRGAVIRHALSPLWLLAERAEIGAIQTYLGCEIERDMSAGTTTLSQKHHAEDILLTYGFTSLQRCAVLGDHKLHFWRIPTCQHVSPRLCSQRSPLPTTRGPRPRFPAQSALHTSQVWRPSTPPSASY
jgi:hypothetical protein